MEKKFQARVSVVQTQQVKLSWKYESQKYNLIITIC